MYKRQGFIPFPSQSQDDADVEQWTQEFRLASDYGERLNWQVGMFYFDGDLEVKTNPFFTDPTTVKHENTTFAVFGQGDYALTDDWTLTAGIRWTDDEKDFTAPGFKENADDDQFSGDLSLSYALDDSSLVWTKVGSGFRAPTIQGRDVAFGGAPSVADSETITSFEIGYKSQFMDDRVRLTAAVY